MYRRCIFNLKIFLPCSLIDDEFDEMVWRICCTLLVIKKEMLTEISFFVIRVKGWPHPSRVLNRTHTMLAEVTKRKNDIP